MPGYLSAYNFSNGQFSDQQLESFIPDQQSQLANEFWWVWGLYSYIDINGGGAPIIITDYPQDGEPQDALGYHSEYDGQPYAVIFAGLCNDHGYPVTGVISHEVLELCADQEANSWNLWDLGNGTGYLVIQEVCDPCESSLYYEAPDGNIVSDFAYPQWWVPGYTGQVDYLGLVPAPLTLGPSGDYITYIYVGDLQYSQIFDDKSMQTLQAVERTRTAVGNPRRELVQRAQADALLVPTPAQSVTGQPSSAQARGAAMSAAQAGRRAQGTAPQATQQQGSAQQQQLANAPRTQGAKKAEITVVRRADVPTNGHGQQEAAGTMPRAGRRNGGAASAANAGAAAAGTPTAAAPRVQKIPETASK